MISLKDEIKEKIKAYYVSNDIDKILNYINNLQQELEELREYKKNATRKHWQSLCAEKNLEIIKLKDYKSRCEKALMYAKLLNKRIKVDYLIEILQVSDKE